MAPTTKETVSALLADVQEAKLRRRGRRGEPALDDVDEYEDAQSEEDTSPSVPDEQTLPLDFPAPPRAPAPEPQAGPVAEGGSLWSSACACVVLLILYVVFMLSQYPL
jgi:hypothetical protein